MAKTDFDQTNSAKASQIPLSRNISSAKVTLTRKFYESQANNASIYFYHKRLIKYTGIMLKGTMEVCTDQTTKNMIWKASDTIFYKQGVTDPDYCVLKFTATSGKYYCDLKTESFDIYA